MKNIIDLTEEEGKQILEFVYPDKERNSFTKLSFEPTLTGNGEQVTLGMRSIIGILYHNGQDNCILHFDNSKVVLWLYKNEYDITSLLEKNFYFSEMEQDFENFSYAIHWLGEQRKHIEKDRQHEYTLEYVLKEMDEYNEKYYFKDYK
jgi:hypothetical protein